MNTAKYVDEQAKALKGSGIPLSDAAWKLALLTVGWPYIFGDRGEYCTTSKRQAVHNKNPKNMSVLEKCQALRPVNPTGSCAGCKWFPQGCRVRSFDCRGFTYWILLQIYGWKLMGSGCTSQWNNAENWTAKGTIDSIPEDQLVCLFYPDKDNPKVMNHTGFGYRGETIECSSGVQHFKTRNKKWTHWGLPKCVSGEIPVPVPPEPGPEPAPEPVKKPTIRRGSTGTYVKECQKDLMSLGYSVGSTGADGIFGKNTEAGVKAFQREHRDKDGKPLAVDGIVGQKTWGALDDAVAKNGA